MKSSSPTRPQKAPRSSEPAAARLRLSPAFFVMSALALAATVFVIYSPALDFQFILDDHRFTSDPRLQSSGHVWEYFTHYVWAQFVGGPPSFYRPVFILWLRLNFILSGMSPWGWHLLSVAKHAAVAALLGLLVWKLLRDRLAVLMAASIFALHPAQTESVAWVTVPDPLMTAGILGALLFYLRYEDAVSAAPEGKAGKPAKKARKAARAKAGAHPTMWLMASTAACFAAMLAKETAIIFPAIILVLALVVRNEFARERSARIATTEEDATFASRIGHACVQASPFLGVAALYLVLRFHALGGNLATPTQRLPLRVVVMSWPSVLWFYVKVLLWPTHSRAFADPALAETFSIRGVLLPMLGVACVLVGFAIFLHWAWSKARRELSPREAVGIENALLAGTMLVVFPILLTLDLNALNPGDFLHGRYTYLPLAGLALLLATAWHLAGKAQIPALCVAGAVVVAFSVLTFSQETQWKDDATVFAVAHEFAPNNRPVARNLANTQVQAALALGDQGRCSEAIPMLEEVTREFPDDWFAWAGMGDCYIQLNDLPQAEASLHRAADLSHQPRVIEQWQAVRTRMQEQGLALPK